MAKGVVWNQSQAMGGTAVCGVGGSGGNGLRYVKTKTFCEGIERRMDILKAR